MSSIPPPANTDLDDLLANLDVADSSLRALYCKLADDPDLATEHATELRDLHTKRTELARQVGMAALGEWRALRAASKDGSVEDPSVPPIAASVSLQVSSSLIEEAPAVAPPAPVSARQLEEFMASFGATASTGPTLVRPDDRTLLLALAAHVTIAEQVTTTAAFEREVEQIERATAEERQKRWREMTREGQVRWLSVLVAWAKALEHDALQFREATLGVSSVFRELRTFSMSDTPGFVHGFARSASPRSATWRADAMGLLREIKPAPTVEPKKPKTSIKASAPATDDEDASEPEALAGWPYLERVKGLRVVLLGGGVREERRVALEQVFQFGSLEWIPRDRPRLVASLAERAARGTVDFILVTKFVAHKETQAISRSSLIPILTMRHGYGVTTVRQVFEEFFARADERPSGSRVG